MVGVFSRFTGSRTSHRRSQSTLDEREVLPQNAEVTGSATTVAAHGIEIAVAFKPIEHPIEPLSKDQPVRCPLPEPSILNDGRIWKERMYTPVPKTDLSVVAEGLRLGTQATRTKPRLVPANRSILPSLSAPEHDLLNLLE